MPSPESPEGATSVAEASVMEIDRWTYEVESPFRPPHEIRELAASGAATDEMTTESLSDESSDQESFSDESLVDGSLGDASIGGASSIPEAFAWEEFEPEGEARGAATIVTGRASSSGVLSGVPTVPLGTLILSAPGRSFSYPFTRQDLLWTAKVIVYEAGGSGRESEAVLWALFNHYAFFRHTRYPSFTRFVRAYSTTLQPVLNRWQAAARHYRNPSSRFVRTGGVYAKAPHIPRGQLQRHLNIQRAPWSSLPKPARTMALRALRGELPNPGIGNANEFASTKIFYAQHNKGASPNDAQWRAYTERYARLENLRWIGDVPQLDQRKNAFFVTASIADVPAGAVRILPPAGQASELGSFGAMLDEDPEDEAREWEYLEEAPVYEAWGEAESTADESSDPVAELWQEDAMGEELEEDPRAPELEWEDEDELEPGEDEALEAAEALQAEEAEEPRAFDNALDVARREEQDTNVEMLDEANRRSPAYTRWVQDSLNRVANAGLVVDGISGPLTRGAIRRFQASGALAVDGIVGPITERALVSAGAPPPTASGIGGLLASLSVVPPKPLVTVCGFFGPNNVRVIEQAVRAAVAAAAQAEFALWHLPNGVPRQENEVAQFGHLVRYWLAAIRDVQPDTLAFLQARAIAPATNYGQLPTSNVGATLNAEVVRVRNVLLAGAPGGGVPATLPALVAAALLHARESHRDQGNFSAWSAVWVSAVVRASGMSLGLEAMIQGRHAGKDELLRASIAHREYAVEAFRRRFGPNRRSGTYHAFEPRAEAIAVGDIILLERRATPGNGVLNFPQTANLDAIRPPTHGDVVVEVTPTGAVTIGGNLGGPQNSPVREGVRKRRYPLDATQRLIINSTTLFEQEDDAGAVVRSQPWVPPPARNPDPRSTARIFAVLRPVETCAAVPGQPYHGGILT